MGCSVQKQKDVKHKQNKLESILQMQIQELVQEQQQQQDTLGDQDELSIYDKSLEKQVKVPKLRQPSKHIKSTFKYTIQQFKEENYNNMREQQSKTQN